MSDTPETDAAAWLYEDEFGQGFDVVDRDFARTLERERNELRDAGMNLYYAGYWSCDRAVNEVSLWEALRDALGLPPGTSPSALIATGEGK